MEELPFKQAACSIMLSTLLLICACSSAAVPKSPATTLTPAQQEEQDPEFWKIWEERRGLGE
jgi:hypothetical protein